MRIGCLGMTTIDTLLFVKSIPSSGEELERVKDYVVSLGGKGMVTALSTFHLGCDTLLFTLVGNKREVVELLPKGINSDYIQDCLTDNNRTWIVISERQEVVTFVYPSLLSERKCVQLLDNVVDFVKRVDLLYISTEYIPLLKTATNMAMQSSIPVISNINLSLLLDPMNVDGQLVQKLAGLSYAIVMNEHEATRVLKSLRINNWTDIKSQNLQEIIITQGSRGGIFSRRPFSDWAHYSPFQASEVECVVGAGDTFCGAYLKARFVDSKNLEESCGFAAEIAGKKVGVKSSYFQGYRG